MLSDTQRERWVALDSAALASPWCPGSNPSSATSQLLHFLKSPCEVPRAAGATCPTHATIKHPPLRPETAGIYCLSVLGPDVPTQRCGRAALPPEASGRVLPGDPASLGLWPYPRSVCIHCRGLSPCLRTPSSLCVCLGPAGRPAGGPQSGFSGVFLMISLKDVPCSSCHIRSPAVPLLLTADVAPDLLVGMPVRLPYWEVAVPPPPPTHVHTAL